MYNFTERINYLYILSRMNQKEFAKFLGTTPSTLSRYRNGLINPTLEISLRIAKKCNVTLDWLAGNGNLYDCDGFVMEKIENVC